MEFGDALLGIQPRNGPRMEEGCGLVNGQRGRVMRVTEVEGTVLRMAGSVTRYVPLTWVVGESTDSVG